MLKLKVIYLSSYYSTYYVQLSTKKLQGRFLKRRKFTFCRSKTALTTNSVMAEMLSYQVRNFG
jgi:hypothetical protein